jgi:hypothetical protein
VTREVPAHPVEADEGRAADEVEERVGRLHRRARVGEGEDTDALGGPGFGVGVEGDGEAGLVELLGRGGGRLWIGRADDADVSGYAGSQPGDHLGREGARGDVDLMVRLGRQAGWGWIGADHDEDVHEKSA